MRQLLRTGLLLVAAVGVALPLAAGDAGERIELSGWITCEYCGKANANSSGAACVRACARKGAKLMLFSEDRLFRVEQQDLAREYIGHEVEVVGVVTEENLLHLDRIEKKKASKQTDGPGA